MMFSVNVPHNALSNNLADSFTVMSGHVYYMSINLSLANRNDYRLFLQRQCSVFLCHVILRKRVIVLIVKIMWHWQAQRVKSNKKRRVQRLQNASKVRLHKKRKLTRRKKKRRCLLKEWITCALHVNVLRRALWLPRASPLIVSKPLSKLVKKRKSFSYNTAANIFATFPHSITPMHMCRRSCQS